MLNFERLRRVTTSNLYIPQIDGLRFIAISAVVISHFNGIVVASMPVAFSRPPDFYGFFYNFILNGSRGVQLFFVISGFVLAWPFARHFINKDKAVSLKNYFLRRLTRLEPPYIFNGLVIFAYLAFAGKAAISQLFTGMGYSLVYLNNNFHLGFPINPVAWSLEIEIQFYILVPLLACVFMLPQNTRRILMVLFIALFPILQHISPLPARTIYDFLQYFLVGFLLVDFYVNNFKFRLPKWAEIATGILSFLIIFYVDIRTLLGEVIFLLCIFVFYFLILNNDLWKKVFSLKFLTLIGGMCYTIYLWHSYILAFVIHKTIFINISNNYLVILAFQGLISLTVLLFFSVILYLLVERPCMDKNWPIKLFKWIKIKL